MDIEGKIILDLPLEEGISKAGNPWKKKGWVLETLGQYPRRVKFDVFGDRVSTLTFEVNKTYVVSLDAESREFNGRWYTDLRAFNARESANVAAGQQFTAPTQYTQQASAPVAGMPASPAINIDITETDPTEDLPF